MEFAVDFAVYEKGRKAPQWTIDSDLNGEMTLQDLLQFTKSNLILIADHALKEEQARGFDKEPVVAVDGRIGKPVINVNPLGKIEFTARLENLNEVLLDAYESIQKRSPVRTGLYKSSNYVFLNGTQIATDLAGLKAWLAKEPEIGPGDLFRFVNIQPYARKLERYGITAQRKSYRTQKSRDSKGRSGFGGRILAPNGTYYLTTRSLERKYKSNLKISFAYVPGGQIGLSSARFKTGNVRGKVSRLRKPGQPYLYPSIKILVTSGGVK